MDGLSAYLIICSVALLASGLTLISGFGLGTLLLPAFILFFDPLEAVAMTAIVHFANNVFKFGLLFKSVDRRVVVWFGLSGIIGAFAGAYTSTHITERVIYSVGDKEITLFAVSVAVLMILFAIQELLFGKVGFRFNRKALIPGGVLSGYFGGLTGHQGALRSMFLLKSGLSKTAYVATGTAIALLVDLTRIPVYLQKIASGGITDETPLVISATAFAFAGAYVGKKYIEKVTYRAIQWIVGILMIGIGVSMLAGIL